MEALDIGLKNIEDEEYFRCTRLSCTLTREVCGKRFLRSKNIQISPVDGVSKDGMVYMPCRGCPEGEKHSRLVKLVPKKLKAVRLGRAISGAKV